MFNDRSFYYQNLMVSRPAPTNIQIKIQIQIQIQIKQNHFAGYREFKLSTRKRKLL